MKKLIFATLLLLNSSAMAEWSTTGKVWSVTSHNGFILIDTNITGGPCEKKGR